MDNKPFPAVNKALLDRLAEVFPDRCASLGQTPEQIFFAAGQRSVVNFLIEIHRIQTEEQRSDVRP